MFLLSVNIKRTRNHFRRWSNVVPLWNILVYCLLCPQNERQICGRIVVTKKRIGMNNNVLVFIAMAPSLLEVALCYLQHYTMLYWLYALATILSFRLYKADTSHTTSTIERHEIQVNNRRTFCNIAHKRTKEKKNEKKKRMKY